MDTLKKIKSAVTALSFADQQVLLSWLQSVVGLRMVKQTTIDERRDAWLQRMEERRLRGATGKAGSSIQQLMNDLRGD